LKRLETFVRRWSDRRAIVGWEVFSELDLVSGATEARAVEFTEQAVAVRVLGRGDGRRAGQ
jgi:hypothetical protein